MTNRKLPSTFVIRDSSVKVDDNGLVSLTDIWKLAGSPKSKKPADWLRLPNTLNLSGTLLSRIVGKSHKSQEKRIKSVHYSAGVNGSFAHPILACAYAGYLSAKLEIEVREVWLRYKSADATLADEILSEASPEANEWAGTRALSRATRNRFTNTLQRHGVSNGLDYAICTNETYAALFGAPAKQLKKDRKVIGSLRDAMSVTELSYIMASESLASERIEDTESRGRLECQESTRKSATFIKEAIEKDRASRRRKS